MHLRTLAAAAVLAATVPAAASPAPIVGGTTAAAGQYPTVVYVGLPKGMMCTGTLIAPAWVMTSAPCVTPQVLGVADQAAVTRAVTVYLDAQTVPTTGGIAAIDTMPDPESTTASPFTGDVGLIHLAREVTDRTPVPINRVTADAPIGLHVDLVGYGIATPGGSDYGTPRLAADLTTESCASGPGTRDADVLCWSQQNGSGAKGACDGDLGGAAFATIAGAPVQVGVLSFTTTTSTTQDSCDGVAGATRLDHVVAWIDQQVGDEVGCGMDGVCSHGCTADPDCPPDGSGSGSGSGGGESGGCSAGNGGGSAMLFVVSLGGLVVVRRRRR